MSTWKLREAMDALFALEQTVDERLHAYRWWQPGMHLPAISNVMLPSSTAEQIDPCTMRDTVRIGARIALLPAAHHEQDMAQLEDYADRFREVVDPVIGKLGPRNAKRTGMQVINQSLGDAEVLTVEFGIEFWLDQPLLS